MRQARKKGPHTRYPVTEGIDNRNTCSYNETNARPPCDEERGSEVIE